MTKLQRAQAYSVVGRAVECGEKSRDVRCHSQTVEGTGGAAAADELRRDTPGARLPRVLPLRIASLIHWCLDFCCCCAQTNGLRRHRAA
jgi:hypothetical protein